MLFTNGIFHSMLSEDDRFIAMEVENGIITRIFRNPEELPAGKQTVDLGGRHVYPCLADPHVHLLMTVGVKASGFSICEIVPPDRIEPSNLAGVEKRIREYASRLPANAVIALNNYILSGIDERRLPTKDELDKWTSGRAAVVYNIDGHSCALSSKMLKLIGIDPEGHDGILQGEQNEKSQGRILDAVSASIGLKALAKGIAEFHNACAEYGIGTVGALEGNGDSKNDISTALTARLARHFGVRVRLYLQYTDESRVRPFVKFMKHPRAGGCGDWEMDGAVGAHSASFTLPYTDTRLSANCYYGSEFVNETVSDFDRKGYQLASHAIGERAVELLASALERTYSGRLHRIEHCEFISDAVLERITGRNYAAVMQPGFAWIDKRYLHTYEKYLPEEVVKSMKLRSINNALCLCGSSDSPVQELDPFLQMLGMVQFYNEGESVTPYQALCAYTKNAARCMQDEDEYGTLEPGKAADFFTADKNFFTLTPEEIASFRPACTYYGGKAYKKKNGSVTELIRMLLTPPKKI